MGNIRIPQGYRIGIDLIEINRFKGLEKDNNFVKRVYSDTEIKYCFGNNNAQTCLATNFSGKEAVLKALQLDELLPLNKVEILRSDSGAPYVRLPSHIQYKVGISLSHTEKYAAAVALVTDNEEISFVATEKLLNDALQNILPDE